MLPSQTSAPSRTTRTRAERSSLPVVTMQPAMTPRRELRKSARTSASPRTSSTVSGASSADEGLLDVLGQLVDHAVGADVDALAVGECLGLGVRTDVEPDDDRGRCGGQVDVGLDDRADARVDHADGDLVALDLLDLAERGLDRALDVGLDDQVELADAARP